MSARKMRLWEMWMDALIAFSPCTAATASVKVSRMERDIDQRASAGDLWGEVLVARSGKVIIDKGYRYAYFSAQVPNDPNTNIARGP